MVKITSNLYPNFPKFLKSWTTAIMKLSCLRYSKLERILTSMILDSHTMRIRAVCPFTISEQTFTTCIEHIMKHHHLKAR